MLGSDFKISENESLSALNAPIGGDSKEGSNALDQSIDNLLGDDSNEGSEDNLGKAIGADQDDEDEIDSAEFDPNFQPKVLQFDSQIRTKRMRSKESLTR